MLSGRRHLTPADALKPSSLWMALPSHLDVLSELRAGKTFFLPPIPSSSSSSASSIATLALLHPCPSV